jgi:hypothetical protein
MAVRHADNLDVIARHGTTVGRKLHPLADCHRGKEVSVLMMQKGLAVVEVVHV